MDNVCIYYNYVFYPPFLIHGVHYILKRGLKPLPTLTHSCVISIDTVCIESSELPWVVFLKDCLLGVGCSSPIPVHPAVWSVSTGIGESWANR